MIDWQNLVLRPLRTIFGEPIFYAPESGAFSFNVTGIFEEAYRELAPADGGFVTTEYPALSVVEQDYLDLGQALPLQDDRYTVTRTGNTYVVREVRRDGHGHLLLLSNLVGDCCDG